MPCSTGAEVRNRRLPGTVLLGLGNLLLRDDGVGIHAVRLFRNSAPRSCLAVEVGTAVLSAAHLIEKARRVIAFDALRAGGKPGSVYVLRGADVLDEGVRDSLHELALIPFLRTLKTPLPDVVVVGAEPEVIDWGMELSPAVAASVPAMIRAAHDVIARWRGTRCHLA